MPLRWKGLSENECGQPPDAERVPRLTANMKSYHYKKLNSFNNVKELGS